MLAKVLSGAVDGVCGRLIQVEVDLALGLPSFSTVGLPEGAVKEAKDRVRAAIKNSGYEFPPRRITVNLAPASLKKAGAGYDLPIALGILSASGLIDPQAFSTVMIIGELSLDGSVKPVHGVLPIILAAKKNNITKFLVPSANGREAAVIEGVEIRIVERLDQAVEHMNNICDLPLVEVDMEELFTSRRHRHDVDYAEVRGQENAKRALEVAAAGGHNILLTGSPGSGKTMMARRLPSILPPLTLEEAIETTTVYSAAGALPPDMPLLVTRPFRNPHHTVSDAGLIGGGAAPRPGEVSLAHNGVLLLDELPEFKRHVLEVMRQPLEDGQVVIARAATSMGFPARFMLVATMNPCPCGYLGDGTTDCRCTPHQVKRYRNRLSGPLLDRIDMHIHVPNVEIDELSDEIPQENSSVIGKRVLQARVLQTQRFQDLDDVYCNADMGSGSIDQFCSLDRESKNLLARSAAQLGLSARAYNRILKIGRTIADLDGKKHIESHHLAEAVQYRREALLPQSI